MSLLPYHKGNKTNFINLLFTLTHNNADPFECKVTGIQVTDNSMTVIAHEKEANFEATCHTPFELGASNIDWLQQMYDAVWQQLEENRDNNA